MNELSCGDYGQSKLSLASFEALINLINQLEKDHEIKNGSTALWVHLVSIISDAIEERN
jgi:hypothetical protein